MSSTGKMSCCTLSSRIVTPVECGTLVKAALRPAIRPRSTPPTVETPNNSIGGVGAELYPMTLMPRHDMEWPVGRLCRLRPAWRTLKDNTELHRGAGLWIPLVLHLLVSALGAEASDGFTLADPGAFAIEKVAGDDLAHDIYTLTTDDLGRVYVSGPGYIRILHDRDFDGIFEAATDFFRGPTSGCQGMAYSHNSLFTTSDKGLERYDDRDSDGVADGPPELLLPLSGGEHGGHALRFGPDGALYFLGGNHCGLPASRVSASSPIRDFYAGVFCRMDSRAGHLEVWTHGLRNAYDFDFTEGGDAIGWDSDSERNEGLAWYRPCRLYHFTQGADCGWRGMGTGELPAGTLEAIAPAAEVYRGSPTGVLCYRHPAFPARYRGGIFALDWTFGVVYFFRLSDSGASFQAERETFLKADGNVSFAPTDIIAAPDGSLLISSGGRGIAGTVHRVVACRQGPLPPTTLPPITLPPIVAKRSLSLETDHIRGLLADANPRSRRLAVERTMTILGTEVGDSLAPLVLASANLNDLRLRHAVIAAITLVNQGRLPGPTTEVEKIVLGFAIVRQTPRGRIAQRGIDLALEVASQARDPGLLAEAARLIAASFDRLKAREDLEYHTYDPEWERIELSLHADLVDRSLVALRKLLEVKSAASMEALRGCARLRDASHGTVWRAVQWLTESSPAAEDMLVLWCLSQLASRWEPRARDRVRAWAIGLDVKLRRQYVGRDEKWALFQRAIWERLLERQPELGDEIVSSPEFGRVEHLNIVSVGSQSLRSRAALKLLGRSMPDDSDGPGEKRKRLEFLVANLSRELMPRILPLLRECMADSSLRHAAIVGLARSPSLEDRGHLVAALLDGDPALLRPALEGLSLLPPDKDPCDEAIALIIGAARIEKDSAWESELRRVEDRLRQILNRNLRSARDWISEHCPSRRADIDRALGLVDEGDALVAKILATVPWTAGDSERGRRVFVARSCGNCHHVGGIGQRVGPDLAGVDRRLGLKELLIEVVDPSRNVPERFYFTAYLLGSGEVVEGKEIYSSNTSISTVTRDGSFRRLDPRDIAERRVQRQSLMPTGLLTGLSPGDIADLVTFLRSQ